MLHGVRPLLDPGGAMLQWWMYPGQTRCGKEEALGHAHPSEAKEGFTNVAYTQSVFIHNILATQLTRRQSPRPVSVGSSCAERDLPHDVCASCCHEDLVDPWVCQ